MHKYLAEGIGTGLLVLIGCGSAILGGPDIGNLGIALSFGFVLTALIYFISPVSGCHVNPAVTLALAACNRFPKKDVVPYIGAQIIGGIIGAILLLLIAQGKSDFSVANGFACNGFGAHSPTGYTTQSCLITEILLTFTLLTAVLATTRKTFSTSTTGITIGFTLVAIHLVSLPITHTSVNIARSISTAVIHGGWALEQLWLFAAAQLIAVVLAVVVYHLFGQTTHETATHHHVAHSTTAQKPAQKSPVKKLAVKAKAKKAKAPVKKKK